MPKTPGTHEDDDKSQQPRQTQAPKRRERSAMADEDRTGAREKLADKERPPSKKRDASPN